MSPLRLSGSGKGTATPGKQHGVLFSVKVAAAAARDKRNTEFMKRRIYATAPASAPPPKPALPIPYDPRLVDFGEDAMLCAEARTQLKADRDVLYTAEREIKAAPHLSPAARADVAALFCRLYQRAQARRRDFVALGMQAAARAAIHTDLNQCGRGHA